MLPNIREASTNISRLSGRILSGQRPLCLTGMLCLAADVLGYLLNFMSSLGGSAPQTPRILGGSAPQTHQKSASSLQAIPCDTMVPWYPMVWYHGIPWYGTMVPCVPWYTMVPWHHGSMSPGGQRPTFGGSGGRSPPVFGGSGGQSPPRSS